MGRNQGLQAARALACCLVLLEHVSYSGAILCGLNPRAVLIVDWGSIGVGLFFVLSGMLMGEMVARGGDAGTFVLRRLIRVYPPFWVAIGISVATAAALSRPFPFDARIFALLPITDPATDYWIPWWTLIYEICFYLLVAMLIAARANVAVATGAALMWTAAIALYRAQYGPFPHTLPGARILFSPPNLLFIVGMLTSLHRLPQRLDRVPMLALLGFAATVWTTGRFMLEPVWLTANALAGVAYAMVLLAFGRSGPWPRWVVGIGDASYGVYLLHGVAIEAIAVGLAHLLGTPLSFALAGPVLFFLALAIAGLYGQIEFATHSRLVRWISRSR